MSWRDGAKIGQRLQGGDPGFGHCAIADDSLSLFCVLTISLIAFLKLGFRERRINGPSSFNGMARTTVASQLEKQDVQ